MKPKTRRLWWVVAGMVSVAVGAAILLSVFREQLVFFYAPSDIMEKQVQANQRIRVGGLVSEGSIEASGDRLTFTVSDGKESLTIHYQGIAPSLFREGQGVVAEGYLRPDGVFEAKTLLAKHDENYMPPEVAESLKRSGYWKPAQKP